MRERALIHVAGPKGAGKTTFIEALIGSIGDCVLAEDRRWDAPGSAQGGRQAPCPISVGEVSHTSESGRESGVRPLRPL